MAEGKPEIGAVAFTEAIDFFRDKFRLPTRTWTDLWQGMHSKAFVVAGAQSDALLKDFQDALLKAMEGGLTLEDFRKDFDRIVATHGWSYRGSRGWRSRVIFNTNMRTAGAAGRWAQIERLKQVRPYIRYVAVMDQRTRPLHRQWHGTVLPVDDPWWNTHFPPCGWNCRCSVQSLSERDLKRFGYKVSPSAPPSPLVSRAVNTPSGVVLVKTPEGIDPGFAYNPGKFESGGPPPGGLGGGWPGPLWGGGDGEAASVRFRSYSGLGSEAQRDTARKLYRDGQQDPGFREDGDALEEYTRDGYEAINSQLRDGFDNGMEREIAAIDDAIENFRTPESLVVYRGLRGDPAQILKVLDAGDTIEDPAFISSSLERSVASRFSGSDVEGPDEGVILVILMPDGRRFYPMDGKGYGLGDEHEILLPRDLVLRVVEKRDRVIVCEVVVE